MGHLWCHRVTDVSQAANDSSGSNPAAGTPPSERLESAQSYPRAVSRNGARARSRAFLSRSERVGRAASPFIQVKVSLVSRSIRSLHIGGLKSAITKTSG